MKHLLEQLIREEQDNQRRRNLTREYLQGRILQALQDQGAFTHWSFLGGTALRFLYALPRYSEDLDFSLTEPGYSLNFEKQINRIIGDLRKENYRTEAVINTSTAVFSAMIKFQGLLYDLGISPHQNAALSIKIEIDTNPPSGALTNTSILRRFFLLNILHYDKSSLLAEKLNALLTRRYTKGRDLFDLVWYLSDPQWPSPNMLLLNNSLRQFSWSGPELGSDTWPLFILEKIGSINWKIAAADTAPFLERSEDGLFIRKDVLEGLLQGRIKGR